MKPIHSRQPSLASSERLPCRRPGKPGHWVNALLAGLCLALLPACGSWLTYGHQPAPAASGAVTAPGKWSAQMVGGGLRITRASDPSRVLMNEIGANLVDDTKLKPKVDLVPQTDGVDVRLEYTNTTAQSQPLGVISLGGIRLADRVEYLDLRHAAESVYLDRTKGPPMVQNSQYPADLYSPVCVVRDSRTTLGVALLYPAVEYRHGVKIAFTDGKRSEGDGGPWWYLRCVLEGSLPPGQTRIYTLTIRAASSADHWLNTLVPYRDYFRSLYGPVKYQRDTRPVIAAGIAEVNSITKDNPRGFAYPNLRPDKMGWGPWVAAIRRRREQLGYERVMIWAPGGLYDKNRQRNYPANSLSAMYDLPRLRDTRNELAGLARDMTVGYWLGYSTHIERGWDLPGEPEKINLDNPEQKAIYFKELDAAAELGATMIGLDAFADTDPWYLVTWLAEIQAHQPRMKYIAEVSPPDIVHNRAAAFLFDNAVNSPPVLADFINPGHETWLSIGGAHIGRPSGGKPTPAEMAAEMRRYADMGYVPLDISETAVPAGLRVIDGSTVNVPAELRPRR